MLPSPGGRHHVVKRITDLPAKCFAGIIIIGIYGHYIAGAAGADHVIKFDTTYFFKCLDGFQHAYSIARAEVEHLATFYGSTIQQIFYCQGMRVSDITDMNEVTDAGTIAYSIRDLGRALEKRAARNVLE